MTAIEAIRPAPAPLTLGQPDGDAGAKIQLVALCVLARLVPDKGALKAELGRDSAALLNEPVEAARRWLELALEDTRTRGFVAEARGRLTLTPSGRQRALGLLGLKLEDQALTWSQLKDTRLLTHALELLDVTTAQLRALERPDQLAALVLNQGYRLQIKGVPSAAKVRARLAVLALERAFGNKIKSGMGSGDSFPAKAGRLLAGHLLRPPREFASDKRLVLALASDLVGAKREDLDAIRNGCLAGWLTSLAGQGTARPKLSAPTLTPAPAMALGIPSPKPAPQGPAAHRPDLKGFVAAVRVAARAKGEGWPGNMKAFISLVWSELVARHPEWALSVIEFKAMLAEAHRLGELKLVTADLKTAERKTDFEASALAFKNSVMHFVRVEG